MMVAQGGKESAAMETQFRPVLQEIPAGEGEWLHSNPSCPRESLGQEPDGL